MVLQNFNELSGTIGECMFQYSIIYFNFFMSTDDQWPKCGRGMSTIHAIFITAMSLYFVFWSDLFSDQRHTGLVTLRSSQLSIVGLGVSSFFSSAWYLTAYHASSWLPCCRLFLSLLPFFFFPEMIHNIMCSKSSSLSVNNSFISAIFLP
jgi:hypothetical protein